MKYLAVLGRIPKISLAELESQFANVKDMSNGLAVFEANEKKCVHEQFSRLGGSLKIAEELPKGYNSLVSFLEKLPEGKITLGVSDYRRNVSPRRAQGEALKLKKILQRRGRSVRVLANKAAVLSTATSHHNQLSEKQNHVEFILTDFGNFNLRFVQNISEYAKRDQARPARDAKVGMLPPKLAQILINFCGELDAGARVLDPFCGTGVVLQEAMLMGYSVVGTDLSERMIEYSERNLKWLKDEYVKRVELGRDGEQKLTDCDKCDIIKRYEDFVLQPGDATELDFLGVLENNKQSKKINAVATEVFLGQPMSQPPVEIKLRQEKERCKTIIVGFLKNLAGQIEKGTPVVLAVPAWKRLSGGYSRLGVLDDAEKLGYNVVKYKNLGQEDLLYYREGQIVAREIIVLRKK